MPTTFCSSRATSSRLPRAISGWLLSIPKEGDSNTFLGNLCQCSGTLLVFPQSLPCFSSCPRPLVLPLGTRLRLACILPSGICTHWRGPHGASLLQAERSQLPQPDHTGDALQLLRHPSGPLLEAPITPHISLVHGNPALDTAPALPVLSRGKAHPPQPAGSALSMQTRTPFHFLASGVHLLARVQLGVHQDLKALYYQAASSLAPPAWGCSFRTSAAVMVQGSVLSYKRQTELLIGVSSLLDSSHPEENEALVSGGDETPDILHCF